MNDLMFDWDQWNIQKNEEKHGISSLEAESAFYDQKFILFDDIVHSGIEKRWIAYGKSQNQNILMIAFTMRNNQIRIISARRASKKERDVYEQ